MKPEIDKLTPENIVSFIGSILIDVVMKNTSVNQ